MMKYFHGLFLLVGLSAVFASRTTRLISASNPVPMTDILVNLGNLWNTRTHTFTQSSSKGLFWVGLIAGAQGSRPVEYRLIQSGSPIAGITRTSTSHNNYDTLSFEVLTSLNPRETLHVMSGTPLFADGERQTGITMFDLSNAMIAQNLVAFSVARNGSLSGYANPVQFNVELINPGHIYDTASYKFTAPTQGIYYFTFSVGLVARGTANFFLYRNNAPFMNLYRNPASHSGYDTMSRSVLIPLQANDKVFMVNNNNQVAWSSTQRMQTRFSGFKYEPRHGIKVKKVLSFCRSLHLYV